MQYRISLIFFFFSLLYFFFNPSIPIPLPTHYIVSRISVEPQIDTFINISYGLLRAPIYKLIYPIYSNHSLYIIFTLIGYISLLFSLFLVFKRITGKSFLSCVLSLFTFSLPIFSKVLAKIGLIKFSEFVLFTSMYQYGISNSFFSVRVIVGICWCLSFYSFLSRKYFLISFFFLVSYLSHPNITVLISAQFIISIFIIEFLNTKSLQKSLYSLRFPIIFTIIGLSLVLIKLNYSGIYEYPFLSSELWYQNLLKDEIDDVSAIFYWDKNYLGIIFISLIVIYEFFSYKKYNEIQKKLIIFALVPLVLFFISSFIEIYSVKYNIGFLIKFLIQTQIGFKIFGLLTIPLLGFMVLKYIMPLETNLICIFNKTLLLINFFPLAILTIATSKFAANKINFLSNTFNKWESQTYGELLVDKCIASSGKSLYQNKSYATTYENIRILNENTKAIFEKYKNSHTFKSIKELDSKSNYLNKIDNEFKQRFRTCEIIKEIKDLTKSFRNNSGIVVPPYMINLRDILENHTLFFVEKHDGNLAIGSPRIAYEFNNRIFLLTGLSYRELSSKSSGLFNSQLRKLFLERDESAFLRINKKYPMYKYLITEKEHALNFEKIAITKNFVLYKIN